MKIGCESYEFRPSAFRVSRIWFRASWHAQIIASQGVLSTRRVPVETLNPASACQRGRATV